MSQKLFFWYIKLLWISILRILGDWLKITDILFFLWPLQARARKGTEYRHKNMDGPSYVFFYLATLWHLNSIGKIRKNKFTYCNHIWLIYCTILNFVFADVSFVVLHIYNVDTIFLPIMSTYMLFRYIWVFFYEQFD